MRRRLLLLSCLLAVCSAGFSPTSTSLKEMRRLDLLEFQPGEKRDSLVKEIGEPDLVSDQANGEKCEAYAIQRYEQEAFHQKIMPRSVLATYLRGGGDGGIAGAGYNPYQGNSPLLWQGLDLNRAVVLCYRKEELVRVLSKSCPSRWACSDPPSSPCRGERAPLRAPLPGKCWSFLN